MSGETPGVDSSTIGYGGAADDRPDATVESRAHAILREEADRIARREAPIATREMLQAIMDAAVTPDAILACVGTMVRGMDAQIASRVTGMRDSQQDASRLTERLELLNHIKAQCGVIGADGNIGGSETVTMPDGTTRTGAQVAAELGIPLNSDGLLTGENLTSAISATQSELQDLNSGNELRMIELQTIVQQRSSILNLGTNLLKAMDDATKNIVGNVR